MVLFHGMPYTIPFIYLKIAGSNEVLSIPFTEAVAFFTNVSYHYKASIEQSRKVNSVIFVISGDTEAEKNKTYSVAKGDLIKRLQTELFNDKFKITDLAIQPEDERLTEEVKQLIGN